MLTNKGKEQIELKAHHITVGELRVHLLNADADDEIVITDGTGKEILGIITIVPRK